MIFKSITHAKMYYLQYIADAKKCKTLIEDVRLEMRCAVCDDTASKFFDSKNKIL